ncbi:MAG: DJ-1/PfpI family protein, partial [Thermoanaerobaculia bacterium]
LVVPSATEMAPLTADPRLRDFIRDRARGASYVASHCAGAFLLGEAGLLEGRRVTTYPGGEADLAKRNPMATVTETEIVVDGDLVTSSGAVVSYEASLSLLRAMTADAELVAAVRSELYLDRLTASPRRGPSQNPAGAARVAGSKEER